MHILLQQINNIKSSILSLHELSQKFKLRSLSISKTSRRKALKNVLNADIDLPTSRINSNINIPCRFRKSTTMEHYYNELTHVPSYQNKKYKTDFM